MLELRIKSFRSDERIMGGQHAAKILEADKSSYLSFHTIASPNDPRKNVPNSHFTDAVDEELARAPVRPMDERLRQ